jgi:hypothetical protein
VPEPLLLPLLLQPQSATETAGGDICLFLSYLLLLLLLLLLRLYLLDLLLLDLFPNQRRCW